MKKILVIGGGTGTFTVLSGLKKYDLEIKAIVSMMDSGGSAGRLRDQLGVLPPSDIRQCLVALSESSKLWRKLFLYRFNSGDLNGHNFGNILITALEKNCKNYQEVIDNASLVLHTKGEVIPVTFTKTNLCVEYEDGEIIKQEKNVDTAFHKTTKIKKAFLEPVAKVNKKATYAILESDYIILGPGDLYTSLIPNLIVTGIKGSLKKTKAKIIYISNLMNKPGQTNNYKISDYIYDLESYLGRKIDIILINNEKISKKLLNLYKTRENNTQVLDDLDKDKKNIRLPLISGKIIKKIAGDNLERSLIRHDSNKIAKAIWKIVSETKLNWLDEFLKY